MAVTTTYPGVYLSEIPSGSRTITGVSTSLTAFIGPALRGPVNEPVPIASFADFERTFGGLWRSSGLGYAVRDFYLNGGGAAIIVRVAHGADAVPERNAATAALDAGGLGLRATGPGAWANTLRATVTYPNPAEAKEIAAAQGVNADDLFSLVIQESDAAGSPAETFLNLTVVDGPRRADVVLAASQLVDPAGALPTDRPIVGTYTVGDSGAGRDGAPPGAADYAGDESTKTGLYALLKADLFNILCIPPPTPASDLPDSLWATAAGFCAEHRAFLVVDPPSTATIDTITGWVTSDAALTGMNTRNAAVYFPRIRRPDPLRGGAVGDFAACGAIAGTYARTDGSRGVWKAPAGIEAGLAGANGLTVPLTDAENGRLNPAGINCLRTFRGVGTVVWGSRTLRGADALTDEYKYIPVRRLALFIEETLYRNTQWVVFEPNDEPLWAQIRASIGAFLQDMFRKGAFQGTTPRDAYYIRCDADTTTQYDIDRGIVNILVGFAPLKPAEFVVIGIQQKAASATA
ncbi:phage tail sheath family protein [Micromonospora sp. NPDC093277]|uniref:phage tail sheath family protein n=1 Tax=Micromonospora sp. NPDC093277 TaxID=3364291 RepID=UPI0037FA1C4E